MGRVWLLGFAEAAFVLELAVGAFDGTVCICRNVGCWTNEFADIAETGVKKGDVGLRGVGEKEDGASVKAVLRDV